jgi:hypothetical protein
VPRAVNLLRPSLHYRRDTFTAGLEAAGFEVFVTIPKPEHDDVLLIWNRYSGFDEMARYYEARGARVLVVENCPLGNDLNGGSYALALGQVALTGGRFPTNCMDRWGSFGIDLKPWRRGGETLILGQRGIGGPETRSPANWAETIRGRIDGRIRAHPGMVTTGPTLADDLKAAGRVVTWSSAAAVQALAAGVPVWYAHPGFVGAAAGRPIAEWPGEDKRDDEARLAVFRRLAWAIWTLDEIRRGDAIRHLLNG